MDGWKGGATREATGRGGVGGRAIANGSKGMMSMILIQNAALHNTSMPLERWLCSFAPFPKAWRRFDVLFRFPLELR